MIEKYKYRPPQKFQCGSPIRSIEELMKCEYVWWNNKPIHREMVLSWQLRFVLFQIQSGRISKAVHTKEWIEKIKEEYNSVQLSNTDYEV